MNSKKTSTIIQSSLQNIMESHPLIQKIIKKIDAHGGTALLVGGAVRDMLLEKPYKDIDIEVHGLSLKELENILFSFGPVSHVGKSFGVLRLHGLDVDWSLPRADESGRKPEVTIDPHMGYKKAFARRDLTINALGINMMTGELIDPFNGYDDLKGKKLRAPDTLFFIEDPLRLYRVMQFVGRLEMEPTEELNTLCKKMDVSSVSHERINEEIEKLLLKSREPSRGFRWLNSIGRLKDLFPEVFALIGVPQDPEYHPEGDVFEHTMQAIDAAASLDIPEDKKYMFMLAVLCHDLGKVTTTEKIEGRIRSFGHELESEKLAEAFLKRFMRNQDIIAGVKKLARYHMQPMQFIENNAKPSAYKRLALKLAPHTNLALLAQLVRADKRGRSADGKPLKDANGDIDAFIKKAQKALVEYKPEEPLLYGRDIKDIVEPGPEMGKLLKKAYKIQIDEGIRNKEELKRRIQD